LRTNVIKHLIALFVVLALSACGFQLRGDYQVALNLQQLSVEAPARSQTRELLIDALERRQVNVVASDEDTWHILLHEDLLDQRIMSLLQTGQVAEYELIYTLPVTIFSPEGDSTQHTIQITRDYQEDPDYALAKVREMELLISEMRRDAVQRLLLLLNRLTYQEYDAD